MSIDSAAAGSPLNGLPRRPWRQAVPVLFVVVVLIGLFFAPIPERPVQRSIFDATPEGARAVYLLLENLGYRVKASRRLSEGQTRWVLFPSKNAEAAGQVGSWVKNGGVLVLAVEDTAFGHAIGVPVTITRKGATPVLIPGGGGETFYPGEAVVTGPPSVTSRTWPEGARESLATVYPLGRGEVWLLTRPGFLHNEQMRKSQQDGGGNAVLACKLAEATRRGPGATIFFDEYHHGMREQRGVVDLLLERPLLWATLQSVVLLALVLWRHTPRFGSLVLAPPGRRRVTEEYLDALANLLERKRAYANAAETVRLALVRDLEQFLGLPAGTPIDTLAGHAARSRDDKTGALDANRLRAALDPQRSSTCPDSESAFLRTLHELEAIRHEFFATAR
jgi:hypothetical protein